MLIDTLLSKFLWHAFGIKDCGCRRRKEKLLAIYVTVKARVAGWWRRL